jgi:hypothetical protein
MKITIRVSSADLRGMAFKHYARVLRDVITRRFAIPLDVEVIDIYLGERTCVLFDDQPSDSAEATEVSMMASEITDPLVRDGYFN